MTAPALRLPAVLLVLAATIATPAGEPPRIGDPGSVFDSAKYDDRYPDQKEWAKAGVEGGIPFRHQLPVVAQLKPGDDIQAALDRAAGKGGVILLSEGVYPVDQTLQMKRNVVLRGADKERTIISYGVTNKDFRNVVLFKGVERAGLEDLTLKHAQVAALDPSEFPRGEKNSDKFVHDDAAAIEMNRARNCWVQNCNILYSVSRPVRVYGDSTHITLRDNLVDRCFHRGGGGSGYYEVVGGTYVLIYNETVRNIRHLCLDGVIDYTVVIHCNLSVDVNWHCIKPMAKSLIERLNSDARAVGHQWGTFSHYRDHMALDNIIYQCSPGYDDGAVYYPTLEGGDFIQKKDTPAPKGGTFYPVTGVHRPAPNPKATAGLGSGKAAPRRLAASAVAPWDGKLLARLRAALDERKQPIAFTHSTMKGATIAAADASGKVTLTNGRDKFTPLLGNLPAKDRGQLALALVRDDQPADHALAAFYLMLDGQDDEARPHLEQAGDDAAAVMAAFAPATRPAR